ncbi:hypothetical protein ABPG72_002663 [Tetrahymena utriculariae]
MRYFSFYKLISFLVCFRLVHLLTEDNSFCSSVNQFYSSYLDTCLECSSNCKACSSLDQCSECNDGYFLDKKGYCLSQCGENQIVDYSNKKCLDKFDKLCLIYDQQNQCLKCQDGYMLNKDQICINSLCSKYQAIYDQYTNKCSLDGYLLSQSYRELQNDLSQYGFSQQSYALKYINFSENLNEKIIEIKITQVFDETIVIGISFQHIILYDYETMLVIQILKFNSQIISTLVQDKERQLIALLSDNGNNQFYAFSKLIAIDLVCYQITTIAEQDQLVNQIFFTSEYLILNQNGTISVFDINNQRSYYIFQNLNIQNISYLEKEGIFLAQDVNFNVYLSNNSPFLSFNQIALRSNQQLLYIQQIFQWSFIPLIEGDQSNDLKQLLIYNITKQLDGKNMQFYTIGELQQKIDYQDQQIIITKQENLIFSVLNTEVQIWQKSELIRTIDFSDFYLIQILDDFITIASQEEIWVYPIQKTQNDGEIQKYNVLFKDQIYFIKSYQNFVVISLQNNIQKLNQRDENQNKLQSFQSSFNQVKIQKSIISTLVYSSDAYSITHLIIQYDTEYLIVTRLYDQQIFFRFDVYTYITQMFIIQKILFIITNSNQIFQTDIEALDQNETKYINIFQILVEGSSLYVLDKIQPDLCVLQLYQINQSQIQACNFQLSQSDQDCSQDQVTIKQNLIVISIPTNIFQVQYFDCSLAYQIQNTFTSFVIIDSNTILTYEYNYRFYVILLNQSNLMYIFTQYNLIYDYFANLNIIILKPSIPNAALVNSLQYPLKKIYLNNFNNLFEMSLNEKNYTSKISSFIINIDGNKLQYLDMTYPIFSYSTVIFQDQVDQVNEVAISSSLMIISFKNNIYQQAIFDTSTNQVFYINDQFINIMYFKQNILFYSTPQNELLIFQYQLEINQNQLFSFKSSNQFVSKFDQNQRIIGNYRNNDDQLFINSLKDGSLIIKKNTISFAKTVFIDFIDNTNIYIQIYNQNNLINFIDVYDYNQQSLQMKSYQFLQRDSVFFLIVYNLDNSYSIYDINLSQLTDLTTNLNKYEISLIWKQQKQYYFISTSFHEFSIFDINGNLIFSQEMIVYKIIENYSTIILFLDESIIQCQIDLNNKGLIYKNQYQTNSLFLNAYFDQSQRLLYVQLETYLLVLQVDTFEQIQFLQFSKDNVYVGTDSVHKIQIYKQSQQIVLFKLLSQSLTIIPIWYNISQAEIFIDEDLGILIINASKNFEMYIVTYLGTLRVNKIQLLLKSYEQKINHFFQYNNHLSVLLQFLQDRKQNTIQIIDVNSIYKLNQNFDLNYVNQYTLYGQNNNNIILINNDINYLTVFDSYLQKQIKSLVMDYQIEQNKIQYYQIIAFSDYDIIVCVRKTDYYLIQYSTLNVLGIYQLTKAVNFLISSKYQIFLYINTENNIRIFNPLTQQFIQMKQDSSEIYKIALINRKLIAVCYTSNILYEFYVYDLLSNKNITLSQQNGKILDLQIENYLVIDILDSYYPTNLLIYQFNESDNSYIIFKYSRNILLNLKLIFNNQYLNKTRSIFTLTVKDGVIAQFWKMAPITLQDNNPRPNQIKQLFLPCSNNTRIKLDSEFFYFMCPFIAQIYSLNTTFVSNIKYIVGFNQTIQDIKYLNYSIFAVTLSQGQIDLYEINYGFLNKIQSIYKVYNPVIYSYNNQQNGNLVSLSLYGISSLNLFQATINYQLQYFKYTGIEYQEYYQSQIQISSILDNYKHIVQEQQQDHGYKILRYQIFLKSPQLINQFPVLYQHKEKDIVEIYQEKNSKNDTNKSSLLQIQSTQFISDKFKNLKLGGMNLLFNFTQQVRVQNIFVSFLTFQDQEQTGFISLQGQIIDFQLQNYFSIVNSQFQNTKLRKQDFPIIQVTYAKDFIIQNVNLTNINCFSYVFASLIDQMSLLNINVYSVSYQQQDNNQISSQNSQLFNMYLFDLKGIKFLTLQDLNLVDCKEIGLISLAYSQIGENSIQINNKFSIKNFNLINYLSYSYLPALDLNNLYTDILEFNTLNLNLSSHLIQSQQQQQFEITQSSFKKIKFLQSSSTIYCFDSQNVTINNLTFFDIESNEYPASLFLQQVSSIFILNSQFKLNNNNLKSSKASLNAVQGNIDIQVCQNLTINNTTFTENKSFGNGAILHSGGAIYASNSSIQIRDCFFENNFSFQERGGAICSDQTNIQIKKTIFKNNYAIVGGAIYYNLLNSIQIDKDNFFFNNTGKFFGNNLGSFPKQILKVEHQTKKTYKNVIISNFQSGNYTKSPIYLQFFDEEDSILNFGVSQKQLISESILSEINTYKISLLNHSNIQGLVILFGEQLQLDIEKNLFQLNITAGSIAEKTYQLTLASNFQDQQISIDLFIKFRQCIIGEVKYPKQNYISCDKCQQGTYSLVDPNQNNNLIQCLKCPSDYATNCYSSNIILKDNFWRESNLTDQIYPCQLQGCSETSTQQINGCLQGYVGPLCSSCDYKGEYWEESYAIFGNQCIKCSGIKSTYAYFSLQLILYILYMLICLKSQVQKSLLVIKLQYLRQLRILQISKTKYIGQDSQIIIKIFISYLQIFSTCIMSFFEIPTSVNDAFKYSGDPIQVTYKGLDCIFKDSSISLLWLNRLIVQIAQITFVCIIIITSRLFIQKLIRKFYTIKKYLIFVFYFYYPSVTKLLISLCICNKIGSKYYMQNDLIYECWANNYLPIQLIIVYPLLIIWCIGIPLLLLSKMRQAIQKNKQDNISFILSYQFIQLGYKDQFHYWEIIKIFQKLIIMIILNLNYDKTIKLLLILAVCYLYQYSAQKCNPYKQTFLQDLEVFLLMIIILSIILIGINNCVNGIYQFSIITTLIISINILGVLKVVFLYYKFAFIQILKKYSKLLTKIIKIFKKLNINLTLNLTSIPLLRVSQLWKLIYIKTFNNSLSKYQYDKIIQRLQSIQRSPLTSQFEIEHQILISPQTLNPIN